MGKPDNTVYPANDRHLVNCTKKCNNNNNNNNNNIENHAKTKMKLPIITTKAAPTNDSNKTKQRNYKETLEMFGWFLGYFAFLVIGGVCITAIEHDNDKHIKNTKRLRLLGVLKKHGKQPNDTMVLEILAAASETQSVNGLYLGDITAEVESTWGFNGGIFYCATLITTIGYGDRFPITNGGKLFTIFYALFGIPFTAVILAKIGIRLTNLIKKMDNFMSKPVKKTLGIFTEEEKIKFYVRIVQLCIVFSMFILVFWILPAVIMVETEGWDLMTSIYYCFITITTIGLGDVTPGASTTKVHIGGESMFNTENIKAATIKVSTILYFLLGLSALTIILNLIQSIMKAFATSAKSTAEGFSKKGMNLLGSVKQNVMDKTGLASKINSPVIADRSWISSSDDSKITVNDNKATIKQEETEEQKETRKGDAVNDGVEVGVEGPFSLDNLLGNDKDTEKKDAPEDLFNPEK